MNTQASNSRLQLDEHEARWFAIYTRYKREKLIRKRLAQKGVTTYLPVQQFVRHYTRKVKVVDLPLISCYLFVKITKGEYISVLETPDVLHFVRNANEMMAIPEAEIEVMRRVVGEQSDIEVNKSTFQYGDEVEIIGGRLTGIKGTLIENHTNKNLLIELNQIGYTLQLQVDSSLLRRVSSAKKTAALATSTRIRERSA